MGIEVSSDIENSNRTQEVFTETFKKLKNISDRVKDLFWIFLADTYIILISFALLKVLELMLRSFWPKEVGLLRTMELTLSLPIVAAYAFLLTFDLGEYFFRNKKKKESDGLSDTGDSK